MVAQAGSEGRNRMMVRLLLGIILFLAGGTILYVSLSGL